MLNHSELSAILYRHDPEGLAKIGCPDDEYSSEAEIILPMLAECDGADDVQELLYEIFAASFAPAQASRYSTFLPVAEEIWKRITL